MSQSNTARADEPAQSQGAARKPEATAKVGNVEIAVWRNKGSSGDFFTASSPTLRYKDGDQWKDGNSYGPMDLLALAEAAREAASKIRDLSRSRP